jgi:hypothetical protein
MIVPELIECMKNTAPRKTENSYKPDFNPVCELKYHQDDKFNFTFHNNQHPTYLNYLHFSKTNCFFSDGK